MAVQFDYEKSKILVVDDIEENLEVVETCLDGSKFDLLFTDNGVEALQIAEKKLPDLILLDIMMPGMDGYEVIRRLKSHPVTADIPVIFLTALDEPEEVTKAFQAGAIDYITKPFNPDELNSRVGNQVRIKQANDLIVQQKSDLESEIDERIAIQESLQRTKEQLSSILEKASEAIFVLQDRRFRFINPKTAALIGLPERDIIHSEFNRFIHPEDKGKLEELCSVKPDDEKTEMSNILRLLNNHNEFIWVKANIGTITWESQPAFLVLLDDISDYQKAQEEINKLANAVNQSPVSTMITGTDGKILYVNPHFSELSEYTAEEVIGKNPRFLQSGKTPKETYVELWNAITNNRTWQGTFYNRKKSGGEYIESARISRIKDEYGKSVAYMAVKEDITERRRLEESLIVSEQRFRLLFENAPLGILIAGKSGKLLNGNKALLDLVNLGSFPETKEINLLTHPLFRRTGFAKDFSDCIHTGNVCRRMYQWRAAKGTDKYFWDHIIPVADSTDIIDQVYVIVEDITERILAEKQIQHQKESIEAVHQDILSSINYAEKIQKAVLPSLDLHDQFFIKNFILYLPRDVVSGDFYWAKQVGDELFIAAADCTGHGVPGALLSILGITLLNEEVAMAIESGSYSSAGILNNIRTKLKNSLHIDKSELISDGMDMALCIINVEQMKMQYAGANAPLLLIRRGKGSEKPEKIHYKPDKMLIGAHPNEAAFTNHEIQLECEDCLYMFSDGYVDQFGGPKSGKYMIRRFMDFLMGISDKPLEEQRRLLIDELDEWKGDIEQVDDILVIGMKV